MSDMPTQEMLAVLRNCGDEGRTVSDEQADAIAARLKALEDALRAAPHSHSCPSLPVYDEYENALFPNSPVRMGDEAKCICWKSAILDTVNEVKQAPSVREVEK